MTHENISGAKADRAISHHCRVLGHCEPTPFGLNPCPTKPTGSSNAHWPALNIRDVGQEGLTGHSGMLIHGASIAREYGLPCVTGVPEATTRIRTGDRLTVDSHLGLVVCNPQR